MTATTVNADESIQDGDDSTISIKKSKASNVIGFGSGAYKRAKK